MNKTAAVGAFGLDPCTIFHPGWFYYGQVPIFVPCSVHGWDAIECDLLQTLKRELLHGSNPNDFER